MLPPGVLPFSQISCHLSSDGLSVILSMFPANTIILGDEKFIYILYTYFLRVNRTGTRPQTTVAIAAGQLGI